MVPINYVLANEALKNLYEALPHGRSFQYLFEDNLVVTDNNQYHTIKKFFEDEEITEQWGDSKYRLTPLGEMIITQLGGDIERYLQYKEAKMKKEEAEHELKIEALRSNIKFNKRQNRFAVFNLLFFLANLIYLILTYLKN